MDGLIDLTRKPNYRARHQRVIDWVNELVIDLRCIEMGDRPRHPVDAERLKQWDELRRQLEQDVVRHNWGLH